MDTPVSYKFECIDCGKEVYQDFPDPTRNITTSTPPYRNMIRCECRDNLPTVYMLRRD